MKERRGGVGVALSVGEVKVWVKVGGGGDTYKHKVPQEVFWRVEEIEQIHQTD